jgi:hypothetical protein
MPNQMNNLQPESVHRANRTIGRGGLDLKDKMIDPITKSDDFEPLRFMPFSEVSSHTCP